MSSMIEGYNYDIFISYRQKDNKYDGWVTEFVDNLKKVNAITLYSVEIDGTELPISRSHKENVLKILNIKSH